MSMLKVSRKRKVLDLNERVDIISKFEKGAKCIKLAEEYGVGKTQVQNICFRDKDDILARFKSGANGNRKTSENRQCKYQTLNEHVWLWFCEARSRSIPITGPLIQEKAAMLSLQYGHDDFMASNGWLDRWKKRYNVKNGVLSGEGADVDETTVKVRKKDKLKKIILGFSE